VHSREGEWERRERERERGDLHDAMGPMRRESARGDMHWDEGGSVRSMETDPEE
jgi:hypothetical protein